MMKQSLRTMFCASLLSISLFSCKKDVEVPEEKPTYNMIGRWDFTEVGFYDISTLKLVDTINSDVWKDIIFNEDGSIDHEEDCCGTGNWKDPNHPDKIFIYNYYFDINYQRDGYTLLIADSVLSPDAVVGNTIRGYLLQRYDSIPQ